MNNLRLMTMLSAVLGRCVYVSEMAMRMMLCLFHYVDACLCLKWLLLGWRSVWIAWRFGSRTGSLSVYTRIWNLSPMVKISISSFFGHSSGPFVAGKLEKIWTTKDNFLVLCYFLEKKKKKKKKIFFICDIIVNK